MTKQVKNIGIFSVSAVVIIICCSRIKGQSNGYFLDKMGSHFFAFVLGIDTQYSKGYSAEKFDAIQIGMNEKDVLAALNEPITRWNPDKNNRNKITFVYSKSYKDSHYQIRNILLENGIVIQKEYSLYLD